LQQEGTAAGTMDNLKVELSQLLVTKVTSSAVSKI
jgi:hypothetical protein